jgi:hypothetical protein
LWLASQVGRGSLVWFILSLQYIYQHISRKTVEKLNYSTAHPAGVYCRTRCVCGKVSTHIATREVFLVLYIVWVCESRKTFFSYL